MKIQFFIFFSLFVSTTFFAQDTIPVKDTVKYSFKFSASGHYIDGTFSQFVTSNLFEGEIEKGKWLLTNYTSYRYNVTMEQTIENNWYQLVTFSRYSKRKKVNPTAFYHFDNNLMFRVIQRHLFGAGINSGFYHKDHSVNFDLGVGADITKFNGNTFLNTEIEGNLRRRPIGIFVLKNKHSLFKSKIKLLSTVFFRQSLNEASDYLLMFSPKVSIKIINNFAMTIGFDYRFENVHLAELSNFNNTLLFGLSYSNKK